MRCFGIILFFFFTHLVVSQEIISEQKKSFNQCKTNSCKVAEALKISEHYLEIDKIDEAQKWIDYSKKILPELPNDTLHYFANSFQSEIFYYMGLYQFGLHEAEKAIKFGTELNDSLYISNAYLIEGINWFEIGELSKTEATFQKAKKFFPTQNGKGYKRFKINKAYIYNNIAQLKLQVNQVDSAYFYNKNAYKFAQNFNENRGIANVERTFGEIFIRQNRLDSATIYFNKSIETSLKSSIYDTALLAYGCLIESQKNQSKDAEFYFIKGQELIKTHQVNLAFQKLFFEKALVFYKNFQNKDQVLFIQDRLLDINTKIHNKANFYTQNIANQYINSENKLLLSKIKTLDKQKNITILQLVAAVFLALILLLIIIIIKRKNKLQKLLLDQKNEISKDLHDDIGSELSSILINVNLLKNLNPADNQKKLIEKVSNTTSEISQRLNTFVWSLNTEKNTVQDFCEYVKLYSYKFLDGTNIQLNFVDETDEVLKKPLQGNTRKNLFFCIKEALNNVVKHANASQVLVSISAKDKKTLTIIIHDNGDGLLNSNKFGNGLKNINKRVTCLNGSFETNSSSGFKIKITVSF
jgi:signal transduction histidine kinase